MLALGRIIDDPAASTRLIDRAFHRRRFEIIELEICEGLLELLLRLRCGFCQQHLLRLLLCTNDRRGEKRSEEHTSELQSLMRNSYAVLCLKKNKNTSDINKNNHR